MNLKNEIKTFVLKLLQDNFNLEDIIKCNEILLFQYLYSRGCKNEGCKLDYCVENKINYLLRFLEGPINMDTNSLEDIIEIGYFEDEEEYHYSSPIIITKKDLQLLINLKKL